MRVGSMRVGGELVASLASVVLFSANLEMPVLAAPPTAEAQATLRKGKVSKHRAKGIVAAYFAKAEK